MVSIGVVIITSVSLFSLIGQVKGGENSLKATRI